MRSDTLPTTTPSTAASAAAICSACSASGAAHVRSTCMRSPPAAVTSNAVTMPPTDSTAAVSWLAGSPSAGTSRRTVIEYDALGTIPTSRHGRDLRRPAILWKIHRQK